MKNYYLITKINSNPLTNLFARLILLVSALYKLLRFRKETIMRKRKIIGVISSLILVLMFSMTAFANDSERSTGEKAFQGVTNVLFGWTEVFASPIKGVKKHGPLGLISGIFLIPWEVAKREVGGLGTLLTAPTSNVVMGVEDPHYQIYSSFMYI